MKPRTRLLCLLLFVWLASGAARAEGSVTLYGILDTGYGYSLYKYDANGMQTRASASGLRDGYLKSSRWGLRGKEDLGNGLAAIFRLEQGFDLGTGQMAKKDYQFSKKAYVGLQHDDWGSFTMGRQKNVADDLISVNYTKSLGKAERAFGGASVTSDSMFKYLSPELAGLQFGLAYASSGTIVRTGLDDEDTDRDNYLSTGLGYNRGPLTLAFSYDRARQNTKQGHAQDHVVHNWMLAATYDFSAFKLALAYGQDRNGKLKKPGDISSSTFGGASITGLGAYNRQGFRSHNYLLAVSAPLAGGQAGLTWTHSSSNLADVYSDLHPGKRISSRNQDIYAAMYAYPLSKRTQVYVYGSYGTGLAYLRGLTATEAGLGLNHRF